jgi:transposase
MPRKRFVELLNKYLGEYLARTGYSEAQFARMFKRHRSTVSKWGSGTNTPKIEDLHKPSSLFQLSEEQKEEFFHEAGREEYLRAVCVK